MYEVHIHLVVAYSVCCVHINTPGYGISPALSLSHACLWARARDKGSTRAVVL